MGALSPALRTILFGSRRYLLRHTFTDTLLTPDYGPTLTLTSGTPVVSGGTMRKTNSSNSSISVSPLRIDVVAQVKFNFGNSVGTDRRGFVRLRNEGATGNRYDAVLYRSNTPGLEINRRDNNVVTQLGFAAFTVADSTDYWVRFEVQGTRFEAWTSTDGIVFVSRLVVTDSTYLSYSGVEIVLVDNVASPTIQADDLMVWIP